MSQPPAPDNVIPMKPSVALVSGKPYSDLPEDLYIPPDALEVFLETFEGPLDLLLYLIKHQNINILDIPVLRITEQYMEYIELMENLRMELAAEYLVMAAMLAEIKSRMLLPRQSQEDTDEDDPRADLVRRLLEYERYKRAAEDLDELPRMNRDHFQTRIPLPESQQVRPLPSVELDEVLIAFKDVLRRAEQYRHHHIQRESLSVRERMSNILDRLHHASGQFISFHSFFSMQEGKPGAVVTLLAILELCKEGLLDIVQAEPLSELWVKPVSES